MIQTLYTLALNADGVLFEPKPVAVTDNPSPLTLRVGTAIREGDFGMRVPESVFKLKLPPSAAFRGEREFLRVRLNTAADGSGHTFNCWQRIL